MLSSSPYGDLLPIELQDKIRRIVLDDKHKLARQLYRCVSQRLHRMKHPTKFEMEVATLYWNAIKCIGCYDDIIVRGARRQHDIWYQELQDPYGMHGDVVHVFRDFQQQLEPLMYVVAFSSFEVTISGSSPLQGCSRRLVGS